MLFSARKVIRQRQRKFVENIVVEIVLENTVLKTWQKYSTKQSSVFSVKKALITVVIERRVSGQFIKISFQKWALGRHLSVRVLFKLQPFCRIGVKSKKKIKIFVQFLYRNSKIGQWAMLHLTFARHLQHWRKSVLECYNCVGFNICDKKAG